MNELAATRIGWRLATAVCWAGWAALAGWGATTNAPAAEDRLLQQQLKQEQIRTGTQQVANRLAEVVAEFERNQLAGADLQRLAAVRRVLETLSDREMRQVIEALQQARQASDPVAGAQRATEAFAGQRAIVLQLEQLLAEYGRQHQLYLLAGRFRALARRQTEIMRQGVRLGRATEGKALGAFNELERNALRLQQIEQETLKPEVLLAVGELDRLAREFAEGPAAQRARAAQHQAREGDLLPALDAAVAELTRGMVLSAAGSQRRARNQLRAVARILLLSEDHVEALRQAVHELQEVIDQQRAALAETERLQTREAAVEAETKQAEVVDSTDLVTRDVEPMAPIAAEHLRRAFDQMQEARDALLAKEAPHRSPAERRQKALPAQHNALASLEQARRALQDQLAQAEQQLDRPLDNLAAAQQLQEQVQALIQRQTQLNESSAAAQPKTLPTLAPVQGQLKDQAQHAQHRAAAMSPEAASALGEAASHMQASQRALAAATRNPEAQQASLDALAQARRHLDQALARLQQAQQQLAELDGLGDALQALIAQQQVLQLDTAKEVGRTDPATAKALARRQDTLRQATGQLKQQTAGPAPTVASHLDSATNHMGQASARLSEPSARAAAAHQADALAELYAAQRELRQQTDALRQQLAWPAEADSSAWAEAQAALQQAQREVGQALGHLQRELAPDALEQLRQRQEKIAQGLRAQAQGSPAQSALNRATQAAQQAADQLAQADLPQAIGSMQTAHLQLQQVRAGRPSSDSAAPQAAGRSDQAGPALAQLAQEQVEVKKDAEALLAALQATPASELDQAAARLDRAGRTLAPLAAGQKGPLPQAAQTAVQSAQQALAEGTVQAAARQAAEAQASSVAAQQALAQAQAALALAQAGLNAQPSSQGQPTASGQAAGQRNARGQTQARSQARVPGQGQPVGPANGDVGNWRGAGGAEGPRQPTEGRSAFLGLPARDRAALLQSQAEKYPQEYAPLIEQYLKNLSDQAADR